MFLKSQRQGTKKKHECHFRLDVLDDILVQVEKKKIITKKPANQVLGGGEKGTDWNSELLINKETYMSSPLFK